MQQNMFNANQNGAVDGRAAESLGAYSEPEVSYERSPYERSPYERSPYERSPYESALFSGVPLYTTRLVREHTFSFPERTQVCSPDAVAAVLRSYFESRDREEFVVCLLDTANTLTGLHVASIGGLAASIVEPRQVFKAAVLANAAALIVAHNHPSGNPEPSREDVKVTKQLVEAGRVMGIPVHDHLILTDHGHTSLAERGLM